MIASYGPLVDLAEDDERAARVAELWAHDGVYDIGPDELRLHGRSAIAHTYRRRHMDMVRTGVAHLIGIPVISIYGDTATALNYTCVFRPNGDEHFYPWRVSANSWTLRREGGTWVVTERKNRLMAGASGEGREVVAATLPSLLGDE